MTNIKEKKVNKTKAITRGLWIILANLLVFGFFAAILIVFTSFFSEEINNLPILLRITYIMGGMIVLANSLRINWSFIK